MALNDFSDSKVTVKKAELLTAIRANREVHRNEFIKALDGYREIVIERLELTLKNVRGGGRFDSDEFVLLVAPMDHTKDYNRVIKMLEMSTADEITVTERQFQQYVLDDWTWKMDFLATNARYSKG